MAILGEAWVVLRAIMDKLHGDVQQGLDDAAKDVDKPGQSAGQKFASALSAGVKDKIEQDFGTQLFEGMNIGASDNEVQKFGDNKAKVLATGFGSGLKNIFKDIGENTKDLINTSVKDSDVQASGDSKGRSWARGFFSGIGNIFKDIHTNFTDIFGSDNQVQDQGNTKGQSWSRGFLNGILNPIKSTGSKIWNAIDDAIPDYQGNAVGKKKGDSFFGGFLGAIGGALGAITPLLGALAGPLTMIGGMGGLIGAAAGAVTGLVAELVALVAVLGTVSAAIGVVAAGSLTALVEGLVLGKMWLTDLTDSAKKVPPAAAAARAEFQKFTTDFKNMVAQVGQETVFPALKDLFGQLNTMMPLLRTGITQMGQAFAGVIESFKTLFANPLFQGNLATVMKTNADVFGSFGKALASLVGAFVALLAAASPLIEKFATWFQGWAQHIQDITTAGQQTGKLGEFFQKAGELAGTFFDVLKQVGGVLGAVISAAAPLGQALLAGWDTAAKQLNDYLHSAQGVASLGNFFDPNGQMRVNLTAVGDLLVPLIKDLADLAQQKGIQDLANGIQEVLPGVTLLLEDATNAVGGLAKKLGDSLVMPSSIKDIQVFGQGIKDLAQALGQLAPAIAPALAVVGNFVSTLSTSLTPALSGVADAIKSIEGPAGQVGTFLGTVLGSALDGLERIIPPLVDAVGNLASAFSGPLSAVISTVGGGLKILADILDALSPVVGALAPEITALAVAFVAMKAAAAIGDLLTGAAKGLQELGANAGVATEAVTGSAGAGEKVMGAFEGASGVVEGLGSKFEGLAKSMPLIGAAVSVVVVPFVNWISEMQAADEATYNVTVNTQGLTSALEQSKGAIDQNVISAAALAAQQAGLFSAAGQWGISTGTITQAMLGNKDAMQQAIDAANRYGQMLLLTGNGPMSDAYVKNENLKKALQDTANQTGLTVDQQKQLAAAITAAGGTTGQAATQIQDLANKAGAANSEVGLLKSSLDSLTGTATSTLQAQTQLGQAVQNATNAMQGTKGAVIDANGALLSTTSAGLAASQGLLGISSATNQLIATMEKNGAAASDTEAKWDAARQSFIDSATAMGIPAAAANKLADQLLGIPADVHAKIEADTAQAQKDLTDTKDKATDLGNTTANPTVTVDPSQATNAFSQIFASAADLTNLNPEVTAGLNWDNIAAGAAAATAVTGQLDAQRPNPLANLNNIPLLNFNQQSLDALANLGKQTPTPTANMNPAPLDSQVSAALAKIGNLASQTPTPTANMNPGPFNNINASVLGALSNIGKQNPTPVVGVINLASGTINAIQGQLNAIHDKTITVTTVSAFRTGAAATGGLIDSDQFTTVGEHGRELIFTTKGQFVATYQQAQTILAAARAQAGQAVNGPTAGAGPVVVTDGGGSSSGVNLTTNIYPSAGMDERALAQSVGVEVAYQLKRV